MSSLAAGLRAGTLTWEQVGAQVKGHGTVEVWPLLDVWELAGKVEPPVLQRVVELARGGVTIPVQDAADFYVIQIMGEELPRPLTLEEATPHLRAALLRERGKAVTTQVVTEILEAARFRLTAYGRRRTGDGGRGSGVGENGKKGKRGKGETGE